MFVDTHCHIYKEYYDDIKYIMNKINSSNIKYIINNACDMKSSLEVIDLSKKYNNMFYTIGLHPEDDLSEIDDIINLIDKNRNDKKFVAIGEIGLDYNYSKLNKLEQQKVFEKQLIYAELNNIPVIIHSRDATEDTLNILKRHNNFGVIHCFNGSVEIAKEYIKLGFKLGINGVITFKNCKLIDTLNIIGYDNIVFETDSPYLTPSPYRGSLNDPTYINNIVNFICDNSNCSLDFLEKVSNKNVSRIFDIKL